MNKMDDIMLMRKKSSPNSPTKIKELLLQISNAQFEDDKISQKLEENETRISEVLKEVSLLKEEFEVEKQNLESKIRESEEYNRLLLNLKKDEEVAELSFKELDTKHKAMKKLKPSVKDEQLLETGKRKHKLYKEFTGIRWDYSAPESVIEGCDFLKKYLDITNKKDFLQKISHKNNAEYKTIRESLWRDIERSTMDSTKREDCKENKPINT